MAQKYEKPKKPTLNRIIAQINKKSGDRIIGRIQDMSTIDTPRISTGVDGLDDVMGGGFPKRRIIELFGLPSGGKSLISLLAIAATQKAGGECVYMDVEDSFDPSFAEKLGVDTKKLIIAQSSVGEATLDMLCTLLPAEPDIIVIDSVAAMVMVSEMETSLEKHHMALKARLMSKGLAKINTLNKNTCIIFINQLRSTLAMYGAPTTTPGGRALPHFASIRLEVKKGDFLRERGLKTTPVIGQVVNYYVTKNKTAPPFKKGSFKFYYEDGKIEE